jgi:hypothetical protein|tara:strand:- start:445 stop:636 length:192 start_codon:yes stop_codon:yes gene_type:complete
MPNEWMDEINKILDDYYNNKIDKDKTISKITSLNADYQDQFKLWEQSVTDEMNESENKEPVYE